jgi:hypothetical protein
MLCAEPPYLPAIDSPIVPMNSVPECLATDGADRCPIATQIADVLELSFGAGRRSADPTGFRDNEGSMLWVLLAVGDIAPTRLGLSHLTLEQWLPSCEIRIALLEDLPDTLPTDPEDLSDLLVCLPLLAQLDDLGFTRCRFRSSMPRKQVFPEVIDDRRHNPVRVRPNAAAISA